MSISASLRRKISRVNDYGFVTVFDALHDMGDPVGAASHVRQSLQPDGTFMIVEPIAARFAR